MIIRLIIAEGQVILAQSLCMILSEIKDMDVISTVKNGFDAVGKCRELLPDVLLIDDDISAISGIEAVGMIKRSCPGIKIVILTSLAEGRYVAEAIKNGVNAYVLKDTKPEELILMLRMVYNGNYIISEAAGEQLSEELRRLNPIPEEYEIGKLKEQDITIIKLISEGMSNREIAGYLNCSEGTVKNKIAKIIVAVGAKSKAQLVISAVKQGLI